MIKRNRANDDPDVASKATVKRSRIVSEKPIFVNNKGLQRFQRVEQKAVIASYTTAGQAITPITMNVRNTGSTMQNGIPVVTDPKSLSFNFGITLAAVNSQVLTPVITTDSTTFNLLPPSGEHGYQPLNERFGYSIETSSTDVTKLSTALGLTSPKMVVGSPGYEINPGYENGRVTIFNADGSFFQELYSPDIADYHCINSQFGYSVSISQNGHSILVGAPFDSGTTSVPLSSPVSTSGAAYWFKFDPDTKKYKPYLRFCAQDDYVDAAAEFGTAVTIKNESQLQVHVLIGAPGWDSDKGACFYYTEEFFHNNPLGQVNLGSQDVGKHSVVIKHATGAGSDKYGQSVAMVDGLSGIFAVIGEPGRTDGAAATSGGVQIQEITFGFPPTLTVTKELFNGNTGVNGDLFGYSIDVSNLGTLSDADALIVGAPGREAADGAVYLYEKLFEETSDTTEAHKIDANAGHGGKIGTAVSISEDAAWILVTEPDIDDAGDSLRGQYTVYDSDLDNGVTVQGTTDVINLGGGKAGYIAAGADDHPVVLVGRATTTDLTSALDCFIAIPTSYSISFDGVTATTSETASTYYDSDGTTTIKKRLERRLHQNLKDVLAATGDTVGSSLPTTTIANMYNENHFDRYYPPVVSANQTRIKPFKRIEITFTGSSGTKRIVLKDSPDVLMSQVNNIKNKKIRKKNYETTEWLTKYKQWDYTGTNDIDQYSNPVEDLSSEGNKDRIAAGEFFQGMAVGDETIMSIYMCDLVDAFDADELIYLPEFEISFFPEDEYRELFVTVIPPTITVDSTSKYIDINYPNYLVPDNFTMKPSIHISDIESHTIAHSVTAARATITTFDKAYFNITSLTSTYNTYTDSSIQTIRPFVKPWVKYSPSYLKFPTNFTGQEISFQENFLGNPNGCFIYVQNPVPATKGKFDTRRWNALATDIQLTSVKIRVNSVKFPERYEERDYYFNSLSGQKKEYLEYARNTLREVYTDMDEFDPFFDQLKPLTYIPFENTMLDKGDYDENILGSGGSLNLYEYTLKYDTTSETAWSTTHESSLKAADCKLVILYVQAHSLKIMGNDVQSTSAN